MPYRSLRNLVIHQRRHSEEALEPLEPYYVLQKLETGEPGDDLTGDLFYPFKRRTDEFVAAKKEELSKFNVQIFSLVARLFSSLEPAFDVNYKKLQGAS